MNLSSKSKYIMAKYHYVHEMIENNEVIIDYILTINIVANLLIEEIFEDLFIEHIADIGIRYIYKISDGNHHGKTLHHVSLENPKIEKHVTESSYNPYMLH